MHLHNASLQTTLKRLWQFSGIFKTPQEWMNSFYFSFGICRATASAFKNKILQMKIKTKTHQHSKCLKTRKPRENSLHWQLKCWCSNWTTAVILDCTNSRHHCSFWVFTPILHKLNCIENTWLNCVLICVVWFSQRKMSIINQGRALKRCDKVLLD